MSTSLYEEGVQEQKACNDKDKHKRGTVEETRGGRKEEEEEYENKKTGKCLTFECESIVLDSIIHVPPDNILYIL